MLFEIPDDWYYVHRRVTVRYTLEPGAIDHWATIDTLLVRAAPRGDYSEPPITLDEDQDLEVQVTVSYGFREPRAREWQRIHIFIEDPQGLTRILADCSFGVRGDGRNTVTLTVPIGIAGFVTHSPWELRAYVLHSWLDIDDASYISPGYDRRFTVCVLDCDPPSGGPISLPLPQHTRDVNVDWAVARAWVTPVDPYLGVNATFGAEITFAPEGTVEYPVDVAVSYQLDDEEPVFDVWRFEGVDPQPVTSQPWTPSLGSHTVRWEVDPEGDYTDDNHANNVQELTFTVYDAPPLPPEWEPPATEDGESEPEEEFDFYVTASPDEQILASSISYTITVEHISGPPNPVQIEVLGVPTSVSYMVDPPSGNPSYSATMTVTAASSLPAGTYPLTIKAVGDGKERHKTVTFIVEEGPIYQLQAQSSSNQTIPGGTVEYTLTITSENGYTQYVNLAVSGLPYDVTSRLEPSADKPDYQSLLSLEVNEDVSPGVYSFTVSGSGVESQRESLTLIIREAAAQQPIEGEGQPVSYYLPILYLVAIIAAIITGSVLAVRYVRGRSGKLKSFCIECGKPIKAGSDFCAECGARQNEG